MRRTLTLPILASLLVLACFLMAGTPATAQEVAGCASRVTVRPNDSLASIARAAYGDAALYPRIVDATNVQATQDPAFARIDNPSVIRPGWLLCIPALESSQPVDGEAASEIFTLTILHMNDVYEMLPASTSDLGGLARVATVHEQLRAENPNTLAVLGGDLLSPSALSTAVVDGEPLAGRQMVDIMNRLGLDYATFGNHEFDLKDDQLLARLEESEFVWLSSNVLQADGTPFPGVPDHVIRTFENENGAEFTIGFFGLTIDTNKKDYVQYMDFMASADAQVAALREQVDLLIAITHQSLTQDIQLVERHPEIDLVLGGHEHANWQVRRGADYTPIFKADSDAHSIYIVRLTYAGEVATIEGELELVDDSIPDDPEVAAAIDEWIQEGYGGLRADGFDPAQVVVTTTESLDGTSEIVRTQPTRLTELITQGLSASVPDAELSFFNAGTIRIDNVISPGPLTQYDVLSIMPFQDYVVAADITGDLLNKVLDQGVANSGTGGFLLYNGVSRNEAGDSWLVGAAPLDPSGSYRVALTDYLLSGEEVGLDYLTKDNPDVSNVEQLIDIRLSFIDELQRVYGSP